MVDIKGKFNDANYTWAEDRPGGGGGGPRGMKIMGAGLGKDGVLFPITPNPHDNPAYNKDQAGLYDGFVSKLNAGWPAAKTATPPKLDKDKGPPVPWLKANVKKDAWNKVDVKNRDTTWTKYTTEVKSTADSEVKKTHEAAIASHVNGKKGQSYTFGGETYKLG